MNLPFFIARRYLISKRSHNAINIITLISIIVVMVITGAMVIILSIMNGITDLIEQIYSPFDQDITITLREGKTFPADTLILSEMATWPGVVHRSKVIEENVLLMRADEHGIGKMKAVEPQYLEMSHMKDHAFLGEPLLEQEGQFRAILGQGLKDQMGVQLGAQTFDPLKVAAPVRGKKISKFRERALNKETIYCSGTFSINLEFDMNYFLVPIDFAKGLLEYDDHITGIELDLDDQTDVNEFAERVRDGLGPTFDVRTRYQKNALMYKTNETEKLFVFVILAFIMLLAAFNVIAALTMLMIEKKKDIGTLMSMGAGMQLVRRIFTYEGLLINLAGAGTGILLGVLLSLAQQHFGFIRMSGTIVDAYPVKVIWPDLVIVFLAVSTIGFFSTWFPVKILSKRFLESNR